MNVAALLSSHTGDLCNQPLNYSSCVSTSEKDAKHDAVAILRLVVSLLSILGAVSIIVSAIYKRQVSSPKVHPIFVLSIADCMLAVLWVVGGALWLMGVSHNQVWCFAVTLLTVVLECVTINLTFVYALFAYVHIKQTNVNRLMTTYFDQMNKLCHPLKVTVVYLLAWLLPVFLIMIPFGALEGSDHIVQDVNNCSCWCIPEFANLLPLVKPFNQATLSYNFKLKKLVLSCAVVVSANYLVVFVLLIVFYYKILQRIKRMRTQGEYPGSAFYGATEALIVRGHSQAKRRAVLFLAVFTISGFCNLILACVIVVLISLELTSTIRMKSRYMHGPILGIMMIQSITVPLQGFLNAIVYGWTREDFLHVMTSTKKSPQSLPKMDCSSDFEDSVKLVEDELCVQRQDATPDTSMEF